MPNKTHTCLGTTTKNKPCKLKTTNETMYCPFHEDQFKVEEKKFKFERPEECIICCEEFAEDDKPLMPCGHWIHKMCVFQTGKQSCPICRGTVELENDEKKILKKYEEKNRIEDAEEIRRADEEMAEEYLRSISENIRTFMSHFLNSAIDSDMNLDGWQFTPLPSITTLPSLAGGSLVDIVNRTMDNRIVYLYL